KDHIDYSSYGKVTSETDSTWSDRYKWSGREQDAEVNLQYNTARYYDWETGRWMSEDPLGFDAGDSNLRRYVNNGPVNATDPSGMQQRLPTDVEGYLKSLRDQERTANGGRSTPLKLIEAPPVTKTDLKSAGTSTKDIKLAPPFSPS